MSNPPETLPQDGTGLVKWDPWLEPYADRLRERFHYYQATKARLLEHHRSLRDFAGGHEFFGFHRGERDGEPGWYYREWAPGAHSLHLIGDFNDWDRTADPMDRDDFGTWHIFLPDTEYEEPLRDGDWIKVHVVSNIGPRDRIPAYMTRCVYDESSKDFAGEIWDPAESYQWQHPIPEIKGSPRIYEAHVGMATQEEKIGTYREFTEQVLPRIAKAGYNHVQLMAIKEHPYYGSFGYQVSNFFAASSRFGTPDDLKELIDTAHGLGMRVLLDLVHSHAVKNMNEGLNHFDGTDHQYFHPGGRGQHPAWDSMCFDYGKYEVMRYLLSNVRYWLEEFHFDGFRFDGVTSMIFHHHGIGAGVGSYDDYFPPHVDTDAIAYLQLANDLTHEIRPDAITIAEEVTGVVGLARPTEEGGLGFDYRLAMSVPDYWIKLLKHTSDDNWRMEELYNMLINRRYGELHIGYAESHDQALVGDKTIAFWLMDADMYWHMYKGSESLVIDRGIALHKMIRLITFALSGEGYLNFIGNEFGHPEWVDFPREGNGFSYKYARRQWALVDNPLLRYKDLGDFDKAMQALDERFNLLGDPLYQLIQVHEERKLLFFRRGPVFFGFNFHPTESWKDHRVGVPDPVNYQLILNTDAEEFGGFQRLSKEYIYNKQDQPWDHRDQSIQVYLPSRSAIVLAPV